MPNWEDFGMPEKERQAVTYVMGSVWRGRDLLSLRCAVAQTSIGNSGIEQSEGHWGEVRCRRSVKRQSVKRENDHGQWKGGKGQLQKTLWYYDIGPKAHWHLDIRGEVDREKTNLLLSILDYIYSSWYSRAMWERGHNSVIELFAAGNPN